MHNGTIEMSFWPVMNRNCILPCHAYAISNVYCIDGSQVGEANVASIRLKSPAASRSRVSAHGMSRGRDCVSIDGRVLRSAECLCFWVQAAMRLGLTGLVAGQRQKADGTWDGKRAQAQAVSKTSSHCARLSTRI